MAGGLVAFGRRYRFEAARAMRESQGRVFEHAASLTPVRTGRMKSLLREQPSDGGLGYTVGWTADDFREHAQPPYFVFVVLGTRFQPANDPLTPALEGDRSPLVRGLQAAAIRAARGA